MSHSSTQQLMDDLRAVVAEAEALLGATEGAAGERAREARHRVSETIDKARERLGEFEEDLGKRARAAADDATRYVRDNPWQAVGVAAVAGIVIGVLIGRR
jgi:ElaB/YqjD/DUF883 family membrane-anchored ribosome-binding protein